jgi:hypothetical protein
MTLSQTSWAWQQKRLTPAERLVLLALADGTETKIKIMERCDLDSKTAEDILVALVDRFDITLRFPDGFGKVKYILALEDE